MQVSLEAVPEGERNPTSGKGRSPCCQGNSLWWPREGPVSAGGAGPLQKHMFLVFCKGHRAQALLDPEEGRRLASVQPTSQGSPHHTTQ